jgi:hypothetical protein
MSQTQKDSQWLQLDVCREFQQGQCPIPPDDCPQAHPLPHVDITGDGKVMACYDSFKGRCRRVAPPCKYYHPTPPLMEVLLARGRSHLAMKNQLQLLQLSEPVEAMPTTSKVEIGVKRSAEMPFEMMYFKRPTLQPVIPAPTFIQQPMYQPPPITIVPTDCEWGCVGCVLGGDCQASAWCWPLTNRSNFSLFLLLLACLCFLMKSAIMPHTHTRTKNQLMQSYRLMLHL